MIIRNEPWAIEGMDGLRTCSDAELLAGFLERRDERAFEDIVRRYGAMVLRVCRDVLVDRHAAEDAFQATFLVLARRAGSIRNPSGVGVWLYGVARRVAVRARVQARQRAARERLGVEVATMPGAVSAMREARLGELRPILHDEVARLPSNIRDAIVLCYFEGLTQERAALALRCPLGTLKHRLTRGRDLLRRRLSRRGVAVPMLVLLALLSEPPPVLSGALLRATAATAMQIAHGTPLLVAAPERIARLALALVDPLRPRVAAVGLGLALVLAVGLGLGSYAWSASIARHNDRAVRQPSVVKPSAVLVVDGDGPSVSPRLLSAGGCGSK